MREDRSKTYVVALLDDGTSDDSSDGMLNVGGKYTPNGSLVDNGKAPRPPRKPVFCYAVIFGCALAFAYQMYLADWVFEPMSVNPMIGPPTAVLVEAGAKVKCLTVGENEWWRYITPMWLHAGVLHLGSNMLCVKNIGFGLESDHGWARIGPLYMAGGLFGTLCSMTFLPGTIMVGASGAAFSLLGAAWADMFLHCRTTGRRSGREFLNLFICTVINLAFGLTPFLDNFAHAGGMVAGFAWGMYVLASRKKSHCCTRCFGLCTMVSIVVAAITLVVIIYSQNTDVETCTWCQYINCIDTPWWDCVANDNTHGPCSFEFYGSPVDILNVTCADGQTWPQVNTSMAPSETELSGICSDACNYMCWDGSTPS